MLKIRYTIALVILLATQLMTNTSQASVRSLGKATVVKDSNGNSFKQVAVTCKNFSTTRFLRQPTSGGKWCDSEQPEFCAPQPLKAAKRVCSKRYIDSLVDVEPKKSNTQISESNSTIEGEPTSGLVAESKLEVIAQPEIVGQTVEAEKLLVDKEQITLEKKGLSLEEERLAIERKQAELEQRKQHLLENKKKLNNL